MAERPPKPTDRPATPRFKKDRKAQSPGKPPVSPRRPDQHWRPQVSMLHERLVGRVIIAWGKLERAVQETIWHFLDLGIEDGRLLTARNDTEDNLIILRALGKRYLVGQASEDFTAVLDTMKARQEERNWIAHGTWGTLMPEREPVAMTLRAKIPNQTEVMSETFPEGRMREIVSDIENCIKTLDRLMAGLRALRDKQKQQAQQG
jgi:DNA polymerase IIIc chi subunit